MILQKIISYLILVMTTLWIWIVSGGYCYALNQQQVDVYNPDSRLISVTVDDGLEFSTILPDSTSSVFTDKRSFSSDEDLDVTMLPIESLDEYLQKIYLLISNENKTRSFNVISIKAHKIFENNKYDNVKNITEFCSASATINPGVKCIYSLVGKINFQAVDSTSCFEIKLKNNTTGKSRTVKIRPWDALMADSYYFDFAEKPAIKLKNILPDDVIVSKIFLAKNCDLSSGAPQGDKEVQELDLGDSRKIEPNGVFTIHIPESSQGASCVLLYVKYIANGEIKTMPLLLNNKKENSEGLELDTISVIGLSDDSDPSVSVDVDSEGWRDESSDNESFQEHDQADDSESAQDKGGMVYKVVMGIGGGIVAVGGGIAGAVRYLFRPVRALFGPGDDSEDDPNRPGSDRRGHLEMGSQGYIIDSMGSDPTVMPIGLGSSMQDRFVEEAIAATSSNREVQELMRNNYVIMGNMTSIEGMMQNERSLRSRSR